MIEIERKFLVAGDGWREHVVRSVPIRQGYISADARGAVRIRRKGERGVLTIKGPSEGISRAEFEYAIPAEDADAMLDALCHAGHVSKTRHVLDVDGLEWVVDVFEGENAGLVLAEVELEDEAQQIALPGWLGEEVSHDERYFNAYLARQPYTTW